MQTKRDIRMRIFLLKIHSLRGSTKSSVLGHFLFLIYMNDLNYDILCSCKIFANDTFMFFKVCNEQFSASNLNRDLNKINNWSFQWKIRYNPVPNKQANKVL